MELKIKIPEYVLPSLSFLILLFLFSSTGAVTQKSLVDINMMLNDLFNITNVNATRLTDSVLIITGGDITSADDINATQFYQNTHLVCDLSGCTFETGGDLLGIDWANVTSLNISGSNFACSACINPEDVNDIDDEDIETDLNTYVDTAGDTTTGTIWGGASLQTIINSLKAGGADIANISYIRGAIGYDLYVKTDGAGTLRFFTDNTAGTDTERVKINANCNPPSCDIDILSANLDMNNGNITNVGYIMHPVIGNITKTVDCIVSFDGTGDYTPDGYDDQVEIQACIDSMGSGGGTILLKNGTYNITNMTLIDSNIKLIGEGESTKLIVYQYSGFADPWSGGNAYKSIFFNRNYMLGGDSNIEIAFMRVEINDSLVIIQASTLNDTVYVNPAMFMGVTNIWVHDIHWVNGAPRFNQGRTPSTAPSYDFNETKCRDVYYEHNKVDNGIEFVWVDKCVGVTIADNYFNRSMDSGIGMHNADRDVKIINNFIDRRQPGDWTQPALTTSSGAAIEMTAATFFGGVERYHEQYIISGNTILANETCSGYSGLIAFNGGAYRNIIITDNYLSGGNKSCIHVQGQNIVVSGNVMKDCGFSGIYLRGGAVVNGHRGIVISDNVIQDCNKTAYTGAITYAGIYVLPGNNSEYITIKDNIITDTQATHTCLVGIHINNDAGTMQHIDVRGNMMANITTELMLTGTISNLNYETSSWLNLTKSINATDMYAERFHSSVASGTAPFSVISSTVVPNLNSSHANYSELAGDLICTDCIGGTEIAVLTDADVSDTLTCSDLQSGSSVVSDAEVDNDLTINGGTINFSSSTFIGTLYGGNITADSLTGTQIAELTDADISNTLTCSNLVAGSEVVADTEVVDDITLSTTKNVTLTSASVLIPQGFYVCLDGATCSHRIYYNGTHTVIE